MIKIIKLTLILLFLSFYNSVKADILLQDISFSLFFKEITKQILAAANKPNTKIKIHLLKDDELNAFATINGQIFVNSGLIKKLEDLDLLICVLAHEISHVLHGDIYKFEIYKQQSNQNLLLSSIFGIGAIIASGGRGDVVIGTTVINMDNYNRLEKAFNRQIETSADYEAIKIIAKMGIDPHKYSVLLNKMRTNSIAFENEIYNPYLTHPDFKQRILQAKTIINQQDKIYNQSKNNKKIIDLKEQYNLLREKIIGYFYQDEINTEGLAYYIKQLTSLAKEKNKFNSLERFLNKNTQIIIFELMTELYYQAGLLEDSIESYKKLLKTLEISGVNKKGEDYLLSQLSYISTSNQFYKNNINKLNELKDILLKLSINDSFLKSLQYEIISNIYGNLNQLDNAYYYLAYSYFLNKQYNQTKKYLNLGKNYTKKPEVKEKYDNLRKMLE